MMILSVESSAKAVSAAIMEDGTLLCETFINTKQTHSETLMPAVEHLLKVTGKTAADVALYAVSHGPGSFTGVRIGIACVKGMAFMQDTPCVGVSTLEAIAWGGTAFEGATICAVMDARCNQVYEAEFQIINGRPVRLCADRAVKIDALYEQLKHVKGQLVFLGDGGEICHRQFLELGGFSGAGGILAPENIRLQRASYVAMAALAQYQTGEKGTAAALVPVYLRLPQAERERIKKMEESK